MRDKPQSFWEGQAVMAGVGDAPGQRYMLINPSMERFSMWDKICLINSAVEEVLTSCQCVCVCECMYGPQPLTWSVTCGGAQGSNWLK